VACTLALAREARALNSEIPAGLHTGEIEPNGEKVAGIALHIGARVMALAEPSQVLVFATVKDLTAGAGISYEPHGSTRSRACGPSGSCSARCRAEQRSNNRRSTHRRLRASIRPALR
jgi:class 3 adenylate cyclase